MEKRNGKLLNMGMTLCESWPVLICQGMASRLNVLCKLGKTLSDFKGMMVSGMKLYADKEVISERLSTLYIVDTLYIVSAGSSLSVDSVYIVSPGSTA